MYTRLYQYCIESSILSKHQYGFRLNSLTEKATFNLLHEIYDALNTRIIVGGIFCDLKNAFDCVDLGILLSRLKLYGIRGEFLSLIIINTYLEGRYQKLQQKKKKKLKTRLSITFTEWSKVPFGVPQGCSVLRSLSFLIYISDLPLILERYYFPVFLQMLS